MKNFGSRPLEPVGLSSFVCHQTRKERGQVAVDGATPFAVPLSEFLSTQDQTIVVEQVEKHPCGT